MLNPPQTLKILVLLQLALSLNVRLCGADLGIFKNAPTLDIWERRSVTTGNGTLEVDGMRIRVRSIDKVLGLPTVLEVIVVKTPKTNFLWYGVERFGFESPRLLLLMNDLWAVEPNGRTGGIRAIRLRKVVPSEGQDAATVTTLIQKALSIHDETSHMFVDLPVSELLPLQLQIARQAGSGGPYDPIWFKSISLKDQRITIEGTEMQRPLTLSFSLDWNLEEMRLSGKPVEFNRKEWDRAYGVWKKALDKEIADTKE